MTSQVRIDDATCSHGRTGPQESAGQAQQQGSRTAFLAKSATLSGEQVRARVINIADWGMILSAKREHCLGDPITINLSESCSLAGTIIWYNGDHCGVKFRAPIDSALFVKRLDEAQESEA